MTEQPQESGITEMGKTQHTLITANKVRKTYTIGHTVLQVLRGASFSVRTGEAVAIVGSSGAGKSTILHILGGLDAPDIGNVTFSGQDVYAASASQRTLIRARHIGFVFQAYHLLPELNVLENAILPAMTGKGTVGPRDMHKRGKDLLASVGLADRWQHRPTELSGGEQQRLALARALMNDPQVVLADEPTGNLDETTGNHVLDYVFSLTKERGRTLVMVTHNERLANRCDRVLHLTDGTIAAA